MKELLGCLQVIIAMIFSALTMVSFIWIIVEIVTTDGYNPFNWWSVGTFVLCFILTAVFLIGGFIFIKT